MIMKNRIESVYEEFCHAVSAARGREDRAAAVETVFTCLEDGSADFESMIYEKLGLSSDDIVEMFDMDAVLL